MNKNTIESAVKARGTEQVTASIRKDFTVADKDIEGLLARQNPADEPVSEEDGLQGV
jgi:hypothetical protein